MSAVVSRLGIVVGVDGSPFSKAAVWWAARDAAMRDVALTVVHVFTAPVLLETDGSAAWESATAIAFEEASRPGVVLVVLRAWTDVCAEAMPAVDCRR